MNGKEQRVEADEERAAGESAARCTEAESLKLNVQSGNFPTTSLGAKESVRKVLKCIQHARCKHVEKSQMQDTEQKSTRLFEVFY